MPVSVVSGRISGPAPIPLASHKQRLAWLHVCEKAVPSWDGHVVVKIAHSILLLRSILSYAVAFYAYVYKAMYCYEPARSRP